MGFCSNTKKLMIILTFTTLYFFAELIVGTWIKSLSLVADSFHMLSDCISIIIGIIAIRASKLPKSDSNTFGWQRAEIYGSLVNCISLMTLCFTILLSSIQRFFEPEQVSNTLIMLFVGTGGLFINLIGIIILHLPHFKSSLASDFSTENVNKLPNYEVIPASVGGAILKYSESEENDQMRLYASMKKNSYQRMSSINNESLSMNMKGVFLHLFTDFIGSLIVCFSALVLIYGPGEVNKKSGMYKLYIDPGLSVIMVMIIVVPTYSLLKQTSLILLQSVPEEINIQKLADDLHKVDNVKSIHDLHVWRLKPQVIIGTVHVKVHSIDDYNVMSRKIKDLFHEYNIHCTTLQPEFVPIGELNHLQLDNQCEISCDPANQCKTNICCPVNEPS